jgi:hypothetical protein
MVNTIVNTSSVVWENISTSMLRDINLRIFSEKAEVRGLPTPCSALAFAVLCGASVGDLMTNNATVIWLVVWNMNFIFSIYWELSSQLTFIFFRGVETINQLMDIKGIYRRICRLLLGGFLDQWRFIAGKTI